ncbi:methyltransferase [Halorientalis sp. IM1011]|uniref:O-methyltransferase n=1 Tax=Halorientalis sp. IM1011 TaxID=1932360 RepID=UPI00097CD32B|nr:O-methyltransferase [Halorientalis sp. IM1011]AQL41610.1 methyltransferase [Halorientalis sp. IM1011]
MPDILPDATAEFARAIGPEPDDVIREMDAQAESEGFPTVGPAVGGWLQLLARLVSARRVFEFGSGFGYSAYWFAQALPDDGEIVLTEVDAEELDQAREYMARGGFDDLASYELGDAIRTVGEYAGPFDAVLIDNEKHRYREAFEAVRPKVAEGGVVIADNAVTAGPIDFEALSALVKGEDTGDVNEHTAGVADYLERVGADPAFETALIPLGEGIAVSHRVD